jgi:hypothetical protein
MRLYLVLASTTLLAACGGTGGSGGTIPLISTPTASTTSTGAPSTHTFVAPTETKTYVGIGGEQVYKYSTDDRLGSDAQYDLTYAASSTTPRNSGISISYDPAAAVFTLQITDSNSGSSINTRFQDPASRTAFGGAQEPQWGTPRLTNANVRYLQAGDGTPNSKSYFSGSGFVNPGNNSQPATGEPGSSYQSTSLFFLKPGSETQYVTYAGYVRNVFSFVEQAGANKVKFNQIQSNLERGAFAYGELTTSSNVPKTGTGSYRGSMLATMIFNPTLDGTDPITSNILPSYFQWIEGTSRLDLDFLNNSFQFGLNGTVLAPQFDFDTAPQQSIITSGATFTAAGRGTINLVSFGGFKGQFQTASLTNTNGSTRTINIAGSTIDGAFYGPAGQEAGGGFRIVGGNPDERIDILGAFVGK